MKRMRGMLLLSVVGLLAVTGLPADGAAPTTSATPATSPRQTRFVTPAEDRFFPACDASPAEQCIVSVDVRLPGDADFEPADGTLLAEMSISEGGTWALRMYQVLGVSFSDELDPAFPVGTAFRVVASTGDLEPAGHMWASARSVRWDRSFDAADGWTQTFEFSSIALVTGGSACGFCTTTSTRSSASLVMADLSQVKAEPDLSAYDGAIVAGNFNLAPTILDPGSQQIGWWGFGSPTLPNGDPNEGWIEAYLPPDLVRLYFGVDAEALVGRRAVQVRNGSFDGELDADFSVLGSGLRIEVSGFIVEDQSTSRVGTSGAYLAAKRMVRAPESVRARGGSRRAVVRSAALPRVQSYQALCFTKGKQAYARNDSPRVVVRKLSPGRWKCQIQGVRANGGHWSQSVRVIVTQ
jgi:hypothetical protein